MKSFAYLLFSSLLFIACQPAVQKTTEPAKVPIKVVVLSMFEKGNDAGDTPGEFQYWVENLPLKDTLSFEYGFDRNLRYNKELGVLGMVAGIGNTQAGISVMALGADDRFDFTNTYWLVAGISGVDPADAPTGSACLLYTSPSPRDRTRSRMPSSA